MFDFLNEKKGSYRESRRIAFEWHDNMTIRVFLCNGTRRYYSTALDLLGYGFYLYCQEKKMPLGLVPTLTTIKKKITPKAPILKSITNAFVRIAKMT
ncbi:hypothetical protein [Helicobacter bizzozeronii]|uniref:hypothetical protein n=1 Tax=Helicobacter bizzozeronii TaxID=56877 RepID=UPI001315668D|nr:hypothetical protein [Helicobacter bizzozeronii]